VPIEGGLLVIHVMDLRPKWRGVYQRALVEGGWCDSGSAMDWWQRANLWWGGRRTYRQGVWRRWLSTWSRWNHDRSPRGAPRNCRRQGTIAPNHLSTLIHNSPTSGEPCTRTWHYGVGPSSPGTRRAGEPSGL